MKISYDAKKGEKTLLERKLDFERAMDIFSGVHITEIDERKDYGEMRNITAGFLDKRMVIMVWTPRGTARHIISLRKANAKEQKNYKKTMD